MLLQLFTVQFHSTISNFISFHIFSICYVSPVPSLRVKEMHKFAATLIEKIKSKISRTAHLKNVFHSQTKIMEEKIKKTSEEIQEKFSYASLRLSVNEV